MLGRDTYNVMGAPVNIRQLRYYYLSAQTGSFSGAARAEGVSVQAVSKSLKELEEELGGPLFRRDGRHVILTRLGSELVEPARVAVQSFDAVPAAAAAYRAGAAGAERVDYRLALVTPPFAKRELICAALARLISHMMKAKATVRLALGNEAMGELEAGTLDAIFTVGPLHDAQCTCLPIGNVSVGMFMGKNHPLKRKRKITFDDLEPYPVLYNKQIDDFNDTILTTCLKRGLSSPVVEISTDEEVADFLEQQQGYILGVYLKALDIKPLAFMHKIDPADAPPVPVCMVTLKDRQNAAYDRLSHFVCNEFRSLKHLLSE